MHKLLERQLRQARRGSASGELDIDALLALVDLAYAEADRERSYTTRAHRVMHEEQADLLKRQLQNTQAIVRIEAEKAEAERARVAAEAELLKQERMSLLGQLTASVAHELRNPLSTIRNTMHAVHEAARAQGLAIDRQLARVERTIDRCDGIIADLLDYAGTRELDPTPLALDPWLGDVLDKEKPPEHIALKRRLAAPGTIVPIDAERLRCAIANLIENAAEAMGDAPDLAERRITVSTYATTNAPAPFAEIVVADTGPGMPQEVLARVFDPLYSTRAFGTGLGLPTAKRIVEQHGGDLSIGSAPGSGTRVRIRLPTVAAKDSRAA
ncbi:MAG TPA: ATP-binding protein [Stellaceae bacterium]|nr:ATP-binding protein [Stellaceae bacterium]